ncbi:Imm30 family immunity protein [Trichocoleus sp. ST-U3]
MCDSRFPIADAPLSLPRELTLHAQTMRSLLILDDECEHHEVMYGLIHFLESFDENAQLQALVDVAPQLIVRAPDWTKILHYRILNDDPSRALHKEVLQSANSENREIAYQLLKEIAAAIINPVPIERLTLVESDYTSIRNLPAGQVGTIVEVYEETEYCQYLVEFADRQGREYAMATLKEEELLVLHYELTVA